MIPYIVAQPGKKENSRFSPKWMIFLKIAGCGRSRPAGEGRTACVAPFRRLHFRRRIRYDKGNMGKEAVGMTAGLVSVSFRGLSPSEVIRAAREAALTGIEWGADVHVPAGDVSAANRVGGETRAVGLRVLAYGSYYKPGVSPAEEFDGVLASAVALRAPVIRVWAGNKGSASATAEAWRRTAEDAARIGRMAAREGCRVAFECHRNTLTDDYRAALRLMEAVREAGVGMYWQPDPSRDLAYNLEAARSLAPYTENIHVFYWEGPNRYPLKKGVPVWREYLAVFRERGWDGGCLLEFMPDDRPESLPAEAAVLRRLMKE